MFKPSLGSSKVVPPVKATTWGISAQVGCHSNKFGLCDWMATLLLVKKDDSEEKLFDDSSFHGDLFLGIFQRGYLI